MAGEPVIMTHTDNQGLDAQCGSCSLVVIVLLSVSQKLSSWLASATAVGGVPPASKAVLRTLGLLAIL